MAKIIAAKEQKQSQNSSRGKSLNVFTKSGLERMARSAIGHLVLACIQVCQICNILGAWHSVAYLWVFNTYLKNACHSFFADIILKMCWGTALNLPYWLTPLYWMQSIAFAKMMHYCATDDCLATNHCTFSVSTCTYTLTVIFVHQQKASVFGALPNFWQRVEMWFIVDY